MKFLLIPIVFLIAIAPAYAHADIIEDLEFYFDNIWINAAATPEERFENLITSANTHIDHINEENARGNFSIEHQREVDQRLEEIVTSNVNSAIKRQMIQKALGQQSTQGGASQGGAGILNAMDKQNCDQHPEKQSCIKLWENYQKFLNDISDGFESGPSNLRPKHIVNITPAEITLFKEDHKIIEIPVFWWSEFDRLNVEAEIISIKTTPEYLGIDFEATPKILSGNNDKIHAIIDGEFIDQGIAEIEVEVKIQVGDQVATAKDMMIVTLVDPEDQSIFDIIKKLLGLS